MPRLLDASFESNWCSAAGALAGVLHALGSRLSLAHISARSGHAFRLAIITMPDGAIGAEGVNHFSAASALPLYARLGYRFTAIECPPGAADYAARRETALTEVRRCLGRGRPAILYALHLPEFGVVRGCEGDDLYASTIMSAQYGERIPAVQWPAPGHMLPIRAFLPDRPSSSDANASLRALLEFAIRYARDGEADETSGAVAGLAAFDAWGGLLESDARISARGQAYVIQALQSGRKDAAEYLRDEAARLPEVAPAFAEAASAYAAVVLELSRMATLFPFPNGGVVSSIGTRRAGAGYVRRAMEAEARAIGGLERALASLPASRGEERGRVRFGLPLSLLRRGERGR